MEGPKNFNTFHDYRLRTSAASWHQFTREPVNPLYYPELLEGVGYTLDFQYESRLISCSVVPAVYGTKQDLVREVKSLPYDFIPLTRAGWLQYASAIYDLVGKIFGMNPGYLAVSAAEFELLYNADYAEMLCPYSSVLVAEKDGGRPVAISLCYPNYAELKLTERAVFVRDYPLLKHRTLLAKTQGVHPDYRKQGLMNYLGAYGMLSFKEHYDECIFCLMRDDNPSLRFTEPFAYEKAEYGFYGKGLVIGMNRN